MTIHEEHPFADPEPDPVRRFRGRVGGTVSLWTSGGETARAGLTVTSFLVAAGEQARVLALLDPDADLTETLLATGAGVVQLLGVGAPRPGRDVRRYGARARRDVQPRGVRADRLGAAPGVRRRRGPGVRVEGEQPVGWSTLVTTVVEHLEVGDGDEPLRHHRGRFGR